MYSKVVSIKLDDRNIAHCHIIHLYPLSNLVPFGTGKSFNRFGEFRTKEVSLTPVITVSIFVLCFIHSFLYIFHFYFPFSIFFFSFFDIYFSVPDIGTPRSLPSLSILTTISTRLVDCKQLFTRPSRVRVLYTSYNFSVTFQ